MYNAIAVHHEICYILYVLYIMCEPWHQLIANSPLNKKERGTYKHMYSYYVKI